MPGFSFGLLFRQSFLLASAMLFGHCNTTLFRTTSYETPSAPGYLFGDSQIKRALKDITASLCPARHVSVLQLITVGLFECVTAHC